MENFLPFFLVLFAAVIFSAIFRRFHLPWVVALIVGGILIGPHVLGVFEPNEIIEFMAQVGLIFLMFMAGLETKLSSFRESGRWVFVLALMNGVIPFGAGLAIGLHFGYDLIASTLLGIIFISSSIAVVIPSLETNKILNTKMGRSIVAATIVEDVASLLFLSILLQTIDPVAKLPLPVFYALLFVVLLVLRWALPKMRWFFSVVIRGSKDLFRQELLSIFVVLMGTVVLFEILGLHSIIAGFFAGLVLSDSIKSKVTKDRLRTMSYGLFIPIFFIVVGAQTNMAVFKEARGATALVIAVVLGSMLSKFISGWLGGRLDGFSSHESFIVGASTIPQLSTTLAVVFTGLSFGLLNQELVTAMVILSIVTTVLSPILIRFLVNIKK